MFLTVQVPVAVEHQLCILTPHHTVQHISAAYIRQYNVPDRYATFRTLQNHTVAPPLYVWAHTYAFRSELYLMSRLEQPPEFG